MGNYFQLYSNCILVPGGGRYALYDLHRRRIFKLNKRISELLINEFKNHTIDEVKIKYPNWVEGIDAYIDMLINEDYGFITEEPHKFPAMSLEYFTPRYLESAVIVFNQKIDYSSIIREVADLGCQFIQLILLERITDISQLRSLFHLLRSINFRNVEYIFANVDVPMKDIFKEGGDLKFHFKIYNADVSKKEAYQALTDQQQSHFSIIEEDLDLAVPTTYGPDRMIIELDFFLEANHFNAALNNKVCIDQLGYIRNYLNHPTFFGNIKTDDIRSIIQTPEFQKLWNISNDKIEKCKACIYRYACHSNSDIVQIENNYYKTEYCNYNVDADIWE